MKSYKIILLNLSILILASCAKEGVMRMTTNTFANKEVIPQGFKAGSSFYISAKQKGDELFKKEVSQKIATILKNKGFETKNSYYADYHLNFSFAMKKSTHVRDVPVYIPDYGFWYYNRYHYPYGYDYGYRIAYVPEEYTLFNKILLIEVYKNGGKIPVWQGMTDFYEEESDLRNDIDYLLVTLFKYFGQDTKKYVKTRINEDDEEVRILRQEYFQQ